MKQYYGKYFLYHKWMMRSLSFGAKVFTKLDANSGFWQIPLAKASRPLTTFITPFGRYWFNKLPFGISSAPEHFQRRMNTTCILNGLEGVICLVDDVLIFGRNKEEHDSRLIAALGRIKAAGVTLNKEMCEFWKTHILFLGHVVDEQGIRADPGKTEAIMKMKPPTCVTELRRFMGMVNQLGKFSQELAHLTHPLRGLLSTKNTWNWGNTQKEAFDRVKAELLKPTVLALYDPHKETKVSADASSYGLGAVLLQCTGEHWRPLAFTSRSLTEMETRYAQIEKEALASTWACEKFSNYLIGMKFMIETDHKPLVPLLGLKELDKLPPRVLRFRLRLSNFDYTIHHVPGKLIYTADALSRDPLPRMEKEQPPMVDENTVVAEVQILPVSSTKLNEYRQAQTADTVCSMIIQYCNNGWPSKREMEEALIPYWNKQGELTVCDGLLLLGKRIVIPETMRSETLRKIHEGHQGLVRSYNRAKEVVWWPRMQHEIVNYIKQCDECIKKSIPKRESLIPSDLPLYPGQRVGTDLFVLKGVNYLITVDYFSRYPFISKLGTNTTAAAVVSTLKAIFSLIGIPEEVVSDNGPQFSSHEFKRFGSSYKFKHVTSSPYFPQSNGLAERGVRTVKQILINSKDPYLELLNYRSTPLPWCKLSPAELLMGRRVRSNLPTIPENLVPDWKYLE